MWAKRVDLNQPSIVEALREAGAEVHVIHEPVDLEVFAYPGSTKCMYVEVKNLTTSHGRNGLNDKQLASMKGKPYVMVTDIQGALGALMVLRA